MELIANVIVTSSALTLSTQQSMVATASQEGDAAVATDSWLLGPCAAEP